MNYLSITKDDMLNGEGLRVVLWISGCTLHCENCQNQYSWNFKEGISFDSAAKQEIFKELEKDYISGITLSGGHPLEAQNYPEVLSLCKDIKELFPKKNIWLYTGLKFEQLSKLGFGEILPYIDVIVDGEYIDAKRDVSLFWRGSSNQRVIDVQRTLRQHKIILLPDKRSQD